MEPNQQPERLNQWSATLHERRTAMFIAGVCIVVIAAAIIAPQWFASKDKNSSQPSNLSETTSETESASPTEQPTYRISAPTTVSGVSAETPVERARPEPATQPEPPHASSTTTVTPTPVATPAPAPKPVTAPAKPRQTAVSKAPAGYFVQVGAFKERKLADDLLKKLTTNGFNSRLVDRGNGMIGVWIGPENSHKAAETLQQELQKRLKLKGFITHSG